MHIDEFTPEAQERLKHFLGTKEPYKVIAGRFGIPASQVRDFAVRHGLDKTKPRGKGWRDPDEAPVDTSDLLTVRLAAPAAEPAIHPAPIEFSVWELNDDPILRFFHYEHLPPALQGASRPFCELALHIINTLPRNAERSVALRKLLEAKDAAVRANVDKAAA